MKIKFSYVSIYVVYILLSGCAAVGVPSTSDPMEKLQNAHDLFDRQGRSLPAERLIREAIEICHETNNSECLGAAYYEYSLFFKSPSTQKEFYRKNGFMDKTVTYENRSVKSEEYFQKAVSLNPEYYTTRGIAYLNAGQDDLALADFDKAIAVAPGNKWPYVNRGVIYHERGEYDQAIASYDKAISLKEDFAKAYSNRGNSFQAKGQFDNALADFGKAISIDNTDFRTFQNRGLTFFILNDFEKAEKDFLQASNLNPNKTYPLIWLYLSERRRGKEDKGKLISLSNQDLQEWPGPIASLYMGQSTIEEVMEETKSSDQKWELNKKCMAFFHVGQYHLLMGNKAQAVFMFRKASSIGKSVFEHRIAKEELKRLE